MKRLFLLLSALAPIAGGATGVRILLGVGDQTPAVWDGSVSASGATVAAVEPWRFDGADALLPGNAWKIGTHPARTFMASIQNITPPVAANGVLILLDRETAGTEVSVRTAQGNFAFRLGEVPYGTVKTALSGRIHIDRVPEWSRLTGNPDEQDYPAAAVDKAGNVWLAYVEFRHNPDHDLIRLTPNRFDLMDAKAGGDQVLVKRFSNGVWSDPIAVTPPGGDLYRPAIAVDGKGRPWVFWSANENGNFDVWARMIDGMKPGGAIRISNAPGSDIDPAAATDSSGNVWVAWQGWRNGKASIFAAAQRDLFSTPVTVASSAGNEWNPAIAADSSGRVSVAWDSYRNGNYDVFERTAIGGKWAAERPVAATAAYEAYPSIAYDPAGTLWVAYEEGGERWGKNFGADDSSGLALYQGSAIRLLGFTRAGAAVETAADVGTALPGLPATPEGGTSRQSDTGDWLKPDPDAAKNRARGQATPARRAPRNTMPRIAVDASGRIWLACRSAYPVFWTSIGTVWTEHLASYSGSEWTGPIYIHHSDNLLDNRPAIVSARAGEVWVLGSSDSRRQFHRLSYFPAQNTWQGQEELARDPYNDDLFANRVSLGAAAAPPATRTVAIAAPAGLDPRDKSEQDTVAMLRKHRVPSPGGSLTILRGEFHRHSEISMDGGGDGSLLDQYRYMIDASYMDWVGCCDHDNGAGREYTWWISQKLTDIFYSPGKFVPMFNYERSVAYPEGHRNVIFARRGIRPLPRLPKTPDVPVVRAPDTQMLYAYLKKFDGVVASHTSATGMGTDWRDNDPDSEPAVEIYQGDRQNYEMPGAPRSSSENDAIGGWRPKGFVNLALERGYKLAFESSSDHVSTHMSYSNILATAPTREALLDALKKRHVYGATDHILADYRSGDHIMGDAFSSAAVPVLRVRLTGTAPFAKVFVVKDNKYVYTAEPGTATIDFTWRDTSPQPGKTSYYYVRGEQTNGELVWVSPMWITYTGK